MYKHLPSKFGIALALICLVAPTACLPIFGGGMGDATSGPDAKSSGDFSSPPQGGTEPAELSGFVEAHNIARAEVGVGPMVWDANVAAFAQEWADELARQGCPLDHRPRSGEFAQQYGENLAWNGGSQFTPERVVELWVSEQVDYDYDTNSCEAGEVCGHYTQVVWRDSTRLGCAKSTCDGQEVWVCNYDPPGNYVGERPY